MQNYYLLLGLNPTASEEEIKAAISAKRKAEAKNQAHANLGRRQEAERVMQVLHEAQLTLLDSKKRATYDQELRSAPRDEGEIDKADLEGKEDLLAFGWKLLIKGEVADAIVVANEATQRDPKNADAWALLGQAKFRWGEIEDAIYEYKRAIKLRPNRPEFYFDLGNIYESADQLADAYTQYNRAAQIDPKETNYRAAAGALLIKKDEFDEGIRIFEECIKEEPDNESYKWFLALGYAQRAESYFWENPANGVFYITSKEAVEKAAQNIDQALALQFDDDDLRTKLKGQRDFVNSSNQRKFWGNWIVVWVWALFYVVPGVLMYVASLRPVYKIDADIRKFIEEENGEDKFRRGEYGAYLDSLPPGTKWAAAGPGGPGFVAYVLMIVLSPIIFFYKIYDNWIDI